MIYDYWLLLLIIFSAMLFSVKKNKLTLSGAIAGSIVCFFIFTGAGFTGVAMLGSFFLMGTMATSWKMNIKEKLGAAEINKGRRTTGQVIANGGVAAIAGFLAWFFRDQQKIFQLMMAAALSAATADTLSSELGTVYGKRFYNIISFAKDKRGENGVVSIEGFLLGFAGSIVIAAIFSIGYGWSNSWFTWIVIAGTIGNITDSILGATLERRGYLKNDAVNFINTFVAALMLVIFSEVF